MGTYRRLVLADDRGAQEHFARGMSLAPGNADLMSDAAAVERSLGQWDTAQKLLRDAQRLDPRSAAVYRELGRALLFLRRYPEARQVSDAGLVLSPDNLSLIERRAMTFLGEGNLAGARDYLVGQPGGVEPTELVAYVALYWDLGWVLTEEQRDVLLRLTPAAFDDDRGGWGLCLAQVSWWRGDVAQARRYAEEARKAFEDQLRAAPDDPQGHALLGLALGYLGRGEEAIREGHRAVELVPVTKDADIGTYYFHLLVRIYILAGQPEKAIDNLERLRQVPITFRPRGSRSTPTSIRSGITRDSRSSSPARSKSVSFLAGRSRPA
jgi:tetratricopeptide (TPR) repeat protein